MLKRNIISYNKQFNLNKYLLIQAAKVGYSYKMKDKPDPETGMSLRYYHVYIYEIGLIPFLVGKVYHCYDMLIPNKIPGWKLFIKFYCKLTGAENRAFQILGEPGPRLRDRLVGWEYEQDLRCYHLSLHGQSTRHLYLDISEEQYQQICS